MQELSSTSPLSETLEHVLSECSAFEHSDRDDLSVGTAELNTLSEEPSGQYEGDVLDLLRVDEGSVGVASEGGDADDEEDGEIEVSLHIAFGLPRM